MLLFFGYMGTILYTGHFRFSTKMLSELKELYPIENRNSQNDDVAIDIDELIMDATYCDPIFKFPRRVIVFSIL